MKWLILSLLSAMLILACVTTVPVSTQTRERRVGEPLGEVVKVDVDLVVLDALVLRKKTSSIAGGLKQEDFILSEDGVKQQITHFSQGAYPLSVLLLVDRGGCMDPFGTEVRHATMEALKRLKPEDEVALMTYHNT